MLLKYLESNECVKHLNVDPEIHASRIEVLCSYANCLKGTKIDLNETTINKMFSKPFQIVGKGYIKWEAETLKSTK